MFFLVFEIGNPVEIAVGIQNKGEHPFNVSQVFASLRHPYDWRVAIQNVRIIIVLMKKDGCLASSNILFKKNRKRFEIVVFESYNFFPIFDLLF